MCVSYHALVVLSIGMLEISVALTVRSAFVADFETELVSIGHSLSADQYNVTLLSVLDKHAPAAKSRLTERMSSPWFGDVYGLAWSRKICSRLNGSVVKPSGNGGVPT